MNCGKNGIYCLSASSLASLLEYMWLDLPLRMLDLPMRMGCNRPGLCLAVPSQQSWKDGAQSEGCRPFTRGWLAPGLEGAGDARGAPAAALVDPLPEQWKGSALR